MTTELLERSAGEVIGSYERYRLTLADDQQTTLHTVTYKKVKVSPRIVHFDQPTALLSWCKRHGVANAMGGGFFLRSAGIPLGDLWIAGQQLASGQFPKPWDKQRGSILISKAGDLAIAGRQQLPAKPDNDLLQAGPLLVEAGTALCETNDPEGFATAAHQFDSDITAGRYPRAALGVTEETIVAAACDGRSPGEAGLSLRELATTMSQLGISDAVNLDGGSSSTLIHDFTLRNNPRGDQTTNFQRFDEGRPIYTAITF